MLSKTFKVLMKWIVTGKTYFEKLFVFDHGVSMWFNLIYQVPFENFCSGQIRHFKNSSFVTFNCSISKIPHESFSLFFFQKFQAFQKHGIALLISINQ